MRPRCCRNCGAQSSLRVRIWPWPWNEHGENEKSKLKTMSGDPCWRMGEHGGGHTVLRRGMAMGIVGLCAFGEAAFCMGGEEVGDAQTSWSRLLLERYREEGNTFLTSMSGCWSVSHNVARVRQRLARRLYAHSRSLVFRLQVSFDCATLSQSLKVPQRQAQSRAACSTFEEGWVGPLPERYSGK